MARMRAATTTELDIRKMLPTLIKYFFIWGLIALGLIHQLLMFLFGISRIYVFVDPPGYLEPGFSLGFSWWFVLLLASSTMSILASSGRLKTMPKRLALPFYLYILFLLIFIKPV